MKKGNKSWKPATVLETFKKNPNYGYRYCANTPENILKKQAEGWELVNKVTDSQVEIDTAQQTNPVTGGMNVRELVLMRIEKGTLEARKAYFDEKADQQEKGIKAQLQSEARKEGNAVIQGDIKIETIT